MSVFGGAQHQFVFFQDVNEAGIALCGRSCEFQNMTQQIRQRCSRSDSLRDLVQKTDIEFSGHSAKGMTMSQEIHNPWPIASVNKSFSENLFILSVVKRIHKAGSCGVLGLHRRGPLQERGT